MERKVTIGDRGLSPSDSSWAAVPGLTREFVPGGPRIGGAKEAAALCRGT